MTQPLTAGRICGGTGVVVCGLIAVGAAALTTIATAAFVTDDKEGVLKILQENCSWQRHVCTVISVLGLVLSAWKFKTTAMTLFAHLALTGPAGAFAAAAAPCGIAVAAVAIALLAGFLCPKH